VGRDLHQQLCQGLMVANTALRLFSLVRRLHIDLPTAEGPCLSGGNSTGESRSACSGKTRTRAFLDNNSRAAFCSWFVSVLLQRPELRAPGDRPPPTCVLAGGQETRLAGR
jgi:hypothetical protein